jgi:hypothetical protein
MSNAVARIAVDAAARLGMTDCTTAGVCKVLAGERRCERRWKSPLLFAGPTAIASIRRYDPREFRRQYSLPGGTPLPPCIANSRKPLSASQQRRGLITNRFWV